MKCGRHDGSLADQDRMPFTAGKYFHSLTDCNDAGGANEDHFKRPTLDFGFGGEDGGIDLASVGIALDHGIKDFKALLGRVTDLFCEENRSSASAKNRAQVAEFFQFLEESLLFKEFEHGGGFAAGEDEAIKELIAAAEVFTGFHKGRERAGLFQRFGVGRVVTLNGKHADS
jgi:hypothetical protein